MGGFGSGRWPDILRRKIPVEMCRCLTVKQLRLSGFLAAGRCGEIDWTNAGGNSLGKAKLKMQTGEKDGLRLSVLLDGGREQFIDLVHSPCNYGGVRWWFVCPVCKDGVYCGSRATKLYIPPGRDLFGCQNCYDLSRLSVQENHKRDRLASHLDKADLENLSISQAMRLGGL